MKIVSCCLWVIENYRKFSRSSHLKNSSINTWIIKIAANFFSKSFYCHERTMDSSAITQSVAYSFAVILKCVLDFKILNLRSKPWIIDRTINMTLLKKCDMVCWTQRKITPKSGLCDNLNRVKWMTLWDIFFLSTQRNVSLISVFETFFHNHSRAVRRVQTQITVGLK